MRSTDAVFKGKVPLTAAVLAGAFVLVIAIYAGALVYPSYQAYSRGRQIIDEKNRLLENTKQMAVTYARARKMTQSPFETQLPLPESTRLPRTNLIAVTERLGQMAGSHHLDVLGHTVHINGVTDQSRFIAMTVQLKGGWTDFRAYLVDIMTLDSFNDMDHLNVYTDDTGTKYYTIDIRLWLEEQTS